MQNNGRLKLVPRFSQEAWVQETWIDSEFGKISLKQNEMTHLARIKHAIEECFMGVLPGTNFLNLLSKFYWHTHTRVSCRSFKV